jgi:hypothetical protein
MLIAYTDLVQRGVQPEGRGFEARWGEYFSIHLILQDALGLIVYWASNRNEYQTQENNVSGEIDKCTAIC